MRRISAISLVLIFVWTLAAPLFAASSEAALPACCRSNGKHHCMMNMARRAKSGVQISTIADKCPHSPKGLAAASNHRYSNPPAQLVFAEVTAHPSVHAQTEARYRIAFSRSRQKRGPPLAA